MQNEALYIDEDFVLSFQYLPSIKSDLKRIVFW